jgi:hypothetical protein
LAMDLLRAARVIKIKRDALDGAARVARSKRVVMLVPSRMVKRVAPYLVLRCWQ